MATSKWWWTSFICNCLSRDSYHFTVVQCTPGEATMLTQRKALFPSTSCANVKGCYKTLWVKEKIPSHTQILSRCVCLLTLKLSFKMKSRKICGLSIGLKGISIFAALHIKSCPVILKKVGLFYPGRRNSLRSTDMKSLSFPICLLE